MRASLPTAAPRTDIQLYYSHPTDLVKGTRFGVTYVIHNAPLNDTGRSLDLNQEMGLLRMEKATPVAAAA